MAQLSIKYYSQALNRNIRFEMYIPNDKPREDTQKMRTVFLLHGYTGDAGNWIPEDLMQKYNFAVIAPNGENGFWLDGLSTTRKYCTFVGAELVDYVRRTLRLALSPEDTYIMGLSMGGFGALHTAFAFPDNFGKVAAMSSALIVHEIAGMKPGEDNGTANYDYYHECFGDLDSVLESDSNPEVLVKRLHDSGKKIPEILMSCGTEDFLLEHNRQFHRFLAEEGIAHTYLESSGSHDMDFWNEYTRRFIDSMFAD